MGDEEQVDVVAQLALATEETVHAFGWDRSPLLCVVYDVRDEETTRAYAELPGTAEGVSGRFRYLAAVPCVDPDMLVGNRLHMIMSTMVWLMQNGDPDGIARSLRYPGFRGLLLSCEVWIGDTEMIRAEEAAGRRVADLRGVWEARVVTCVTADGRVVTVFRRRGQRPMVVEEGKVAGTTLLALTTAVLTVVGGVGPEEQVTALVEKIVGILARMEDGGAS